MCDGQAEEESQKEGQKNQQQPGAKVMRILIRSKTTLLVLPALLLATLALSTAPAQAEETRRPGWEVTANTDPTDLAPSGGTGLIEVNVYNVGAEKSAGPVTVTDTLPSGILATEAADAQDGNGESLGEEGLWDCSVGDGEVVTCVNDPEKLPSLPWPQPPTEAGGNEAGGNGSLVGSGHILHIGIKVKVETQTPGTLTNHVTVAGGGALAPGSTSAPVTVSSAPTPPFGFQGSDGWFSNADGTLDTQAGSHPYEFVYSFDLNTSYFDSSGKKHETLRSAGGEPRDLTGNLPPGFIGNPTAVPECTRQQFEEAACPPASQVGVDLAGLKAGSLYPFRVPIAVFNLAPPAGIPAQFAFTLFGIPTYLDAGVRSGGDYGITVHANNIVEEDVMDNRITFWGEPGDPSHNEDRHTGFRQGGVLVCDFGCSSNAPHVPFLTLPTSCAAEAPAVTASLNTWETAGLGEASFAFHDNNDTPTGFTGCDHLGFGPTISVAPDTTSADTPAGLTVDVKVPQEGLTASGALATSNIKDTTVALPPGLVINPGQAAGLQACQPAEAHVGDGKEDAPECPNASKVGTVQIATPLLKENLEGNVYVLQSNPPNLKLLFAASGEGVNLKLVGDASLCERAGEELNGKTCQAPGQLITRLSETPELPFTDFKLSFSGGAQAALDTPTQCGEHTTSSDFTPWSTPSVGDVFPSSAFAISGGPNGSACPSSSLPFGPSLNAGATTDQAGAFTGFSLLLRSGDGQQRIEKLQFKAPEGLSGMLSAVPLCPEPQAAQGTCSAASQIGHSTVASGPGPYPLTVPQPGDPESPIYLTGPYNGRGACNVSEAGCAPFGLTIVTHVIAGPFNLGNVITRAKIEVDRHTAQITVTTDALPQVIDGVPTDLRLVDAEIDRPGFMFNPTNCNPSSFSGTASGTPPPGAGGPGASAPLSDRFQVLSCQSLKFAPSFKVSTSGKTSKARGASLTAKILYPSTPPGAQATNYANIARAKVDLPKQLPSRLTTLQKACTNAQFEANPAGCPAASVIGHARVITPLLPVPVEGPAYFVSHGGEAFPSLIMVLQGYGVRVDLIGTTFISKAGITSSTFKSTPDVPLTSFELTLPQGKFSALAANGNLCTSKLAMPTEFVAQNGAKINESTKISVTGCGKAKALTRSQKLTRALKVCKKKAKAKRGGCQAKARKQYGPLKQSKKKGKE
jgi:hypothetical protein